MGISIIMIHGSIGSELWHDRQQGFYSKQVSRYLALFDRKQLLFLLYDDFVLVREYRTNILQLSELIGCDLSNWLVSEPNETSSVR